MSSSPSKLTVSLRTSDYDSVSTLSVDACVKNLTDKSAIAEHAWTNDHPINWAEKKILQRANRAMELVLKESLNIHMYA